MTDQPGTTTVIWPDGSPGRMITWEPGRKEVTYEPDGQPAKAVSTVTNDGSKRHEVRELP